MAPSVELQVLLSLETFVTDFTDESVGGHKRLG